MLKSDYTHAMFRYATQPYVGLVTRMLRNSPEARAGNA